MLGWQRAVHHSPTSTGYCFAFTSFKESQITVWGEQITARQTSSYQKNCLILFTGHKNMNSTRKNHKCCSHQFYVYMYFCIRLGQVRESFVNLRRPFGTFRQMSGLLELPTWPYEGCRHSGSGNRVQSRQFTHCNAMRTVVPRKYDKLEYGIDIPSLSWLNWHR
jgi:hypothetical protein